MYRLTNTSEKNNSNEESDVSSTHTKITSEIGESNQDFHANCKLSHPLHIAPESLKIFHENTNDCSVEVLQVKSQTLEENENSCSPTESDLVQNDSRQNPCYTFVESAMYLDIFCFEIVKNIQEIIQQCESPIAIEGSEMLSNVIDTPQVFLSMIEEAVTNSFQLLNFHDDSASWNTLIKRGLRTMRNEFSKLHKIVAKIQGIFLDLENRIKQLKRRTYSTLGGNVKAAALINAKYALEKYKEGISEGQNSKSSLRQGESQEDNINCFSLQIRLSLGYLTLKSKSYFDSWIKFKSISSMKHRKTIIELMIENFLAIASSTIQVLNVMMNFLQSHNYNNTENKNNPEIFSMNEVTDKLDKIKQIIHDNGNKGVKFSPKEQTIMLANWQKAEIGLDFLMSKIKHLFGITENLQYCTNRLLRRNYLEFVADDGRSTLTLDKFSSVEIEIKTVRNEADIYSIFETYFGVERRFNWNTPVELASYGENKFEGLPQPHENIEADKTEDSDRIIISEDEGDDSKSCSTTSTHLEPSEILMNEICFLANEIEMIPEEYQNALELELKDMCSIDVKDSHINLCSDRIKTFHQQIIFLQETISRNDKIICEQTDEIFDTKEDSLNADLWNCIGVTFQLIKTSEFRTRMSSRDNVAFQNHFEEVLRYFGEMTKVTGDYKKAVKTKLDQINMYINDIAHVDDFFHEQRDKCKHNKQYKFSCEEPERKDCSVSSILSKNSKVSNEDKQTKDKNFQSEDLDDILFYKIKLTDILSQVSILESEFKNPNNSGDSVNANEKPIRNNNRKKPFEVFLSEANTKILFVCLCHTKELCNRIARNLGTMISTIELSSNLKNFLKSWLKVDKHISHSHILEKLVLCKSLFGLELLYVRHFESFGNFETLLGTFTGLVDLLQNQIIYKGMIEYESTIFCKNKISSKDKDILEQMSSFGISEYENLTLKIKMLYFKRVTNDATSMKNETNNSACVENEEKISTEQHTVLSLIPNVFSRLTRAEDEECPHKPYGINLNQLLSEKLKKSNSFILGGLMEIAENVCCPKVPQEYETAPVAYVNILAFLICNTSSKLQISPTPIPKELMKEFKNEYLLVKSVIRACESAGKKANAFFNKKIKSFETKKKFSKKYYTEEEMKLINRELGSPSAVRLFSSIWKSANEQCVETKNTHTLSTLDEFNFTWKSIDNHELFCSSSKNSVTSEFSSMNLEIQIKIITSLLRMIRDALRKSEMSFSQFKRNIRECRKELDIIWKRNFTDLHSTSFGFTLHTLLFSYIISEACCCFQSIADIIKSVKFYIFYGFKSFFGTSKEKAKLLSRRLFKPVQCSELLFKVQCDLGITVNATPDIAPISNEASTSKYILEQHLNKDTKQEYVPVEISVLGNAYSSARTRNSLDSKVDTNSNAENSNIVISEESPNVSNQYLDNKFPDQDNDVSNDSLPIIQNILSKTPSLTNFDKINLALKRFEDLLNSGLRQSLQIIKYPNSAVNTIHFLELGNTVDFIKGIITLVACSSTDLHQFIQTRAEIINPLDLEFQKAEMYFDKNFLKEKSYAAQTKLNVYQIKNKMYDFVKETVRDNDKLLEEVLETFDNTKDDSKSDNKNEVNSEHLYHFDLANNLAKQISGSVWSVRWGMDNLGVIFTSKVTQENFMFKSLSLESQLNVLTLLLKFLVFILKTVSCTMSAVKKNLNKAKQFYTTKFQKLLRSTLSSEYTTLTYATREEQKEFTFFVSKFNEMLHSSTSSIDELHEIAQTVFKSMLETKNYIKIRVALETARKEQSTKMINCINSYRGAYKRRLAQFRSNLLKQHFCPIGVDVPLTFVL